MTASESCTPVAPVPSAMSCTVEQPSTLYASHYAPRSQVAAHLQVLWLFVFICGAAFYRLYQNAQQLTLAVSTFPRTGLTLMAAGFTCFLKRLSSSLPTPSSFAAGAGVA